MKFAEKIAARLSVMILGLLLVAMLAVGPLLAQTPLPTTTPFPTITLTPVRTLIRPTSTALAGIRACVYRPTFRRNPWSLPDLGCMETVIDDPSGGLLGFTALAVGPDGTLYAARPLTGQVFAITDTDGDLLPDHPTVIADGLTLPNGLDYAGDALYISGGARLYRLRDEKLDTLVDDLPSGGGFWTGGIAVGPDQRLYVSTGAACDACAPTDPARGAVLSFDLDGGDRQLVATGLREPADLAFAGSALWTVDTARDALGGVADLDELNQVVPGANFGFPFCIGADNRPDLGGGRNCASAAAPALTFPTHSHPVGLAFYRGDALPFLKDTLLVVLAGTVNQAYMDGYAVVGVRLDAQGSPTDSQILIPAQSTEKGEQFSLQQYNYRTSGFWPRRPLDVAVDPRGWVYISVGDGLIISLRPN